MFFGVVGINVCWRFFCYGFGMIYRRYVDGFWFEGVFNEECEYVIDVFDGKVCLRLIFLIYFIEGFNGGLMMFYIVMLSEFGVLSARGVVL